MAPTSKPEEPQPAAGQYRPGSSVVLGTDPLKRSIDDLDKAIKDQTDAIKKQVYASTGGDVHATRFANNPSALSQWNEMRRQKQQSVDTASTKRQSDVEAQQSTQSFGGNVARAQARLSATMRPSPWTPQTFPKMGVPSQPTPASAMNQVGAFGYYGSTPSGPAAPMNLPWQQPSTSAPGWGGASTNGGSQSNMPRPPKMSLPSPGGGFGGGGSGGGAAGAASGGGFMSQAKSFIGGNKGMIGVGLAAGALSAAGSAFNSMSSRMLNNNFDEFGNMVVLRNGGYSGQTYGGATHQADTSLLPAAYAATSEQDLIGGGAQILANSGPNFTRNLAAASAASYAAPGLGIQGGASLEQQLGTNQANVIAQGMFGAPTRNRGGTQQSPFQVANSILNATTSGQGSKITPQILSQMLMQGGSLRTNLNTYAQAAGLSSDSVDSLAQILTAQSDYMSRNKGATPQDFEQIMTAASQNDKAARAKLKGSGIGESVIQSFQNRQAETTKRDISMQAGFVDTLKATNGFLAKLNSYLSDIIGNKVGGALTGFNAGSGGRLGGAMGGAAAGALLGSVVPGLGTAAGAIVGGVGGFIFGGASSTAKGSSGPAQGTTAPPTNASGAANIAMAFAKAQEGKPYVMGAVGPNAYDCSSLVQAAYKAAGVSIPRVSSQQAEAGVAVPLDQIGPGDLLFPKDELGQNGAPPGLPGHVAMALTGGPNILTVQAESPSRGIREEYMNVSDLWGARRVSGGVGTLSPNQNTSSTGASNTNSNTSAGQAQTTGTSTNSSAAMAVSQGSLGLNEVDVLGSLLGRAASAGGPIPAASAQQAQMMSVNGTAGPAASYAKGAYSIDGDQVANVHDGEMILDSKLSRSVRAAVMSDIPNHTVAGNSSPTINFSQGSINITVGGSPTQSNMQTAAKQFVSAVAADKRIQTIGAGL